MGDGTFVVPSSWMCWEMSELVVRARWLDIVCPFSALFDGRKVTSDSSSA